MWDYRMFQKLWITMGPLWNRITHSLTKVPTTYFISVDNISLYQTIFTSVSIENSLPITWKLLLFCGFFFGVPSLAPMKYSKMLQSGGQKCFEPFFDQVGIKLKPTCRFLFICGIFFALNLSNPTGIGWRSNSTPISMSIWKKNYGGSIG